MDVHGTVQSYRDCLVQVGGGCKEDDSRLGEGGGAHHSLKEYDLVTISLLCSVCGVCTSQALFMWAAFFIYNNYLLVYMHVHVCYRVKIFTT